MPITLPYNQIADAIVKVLNKDSRVLFAYIYGSALLEGKGNDIDIAIYSDERSDNYSLSADLKIELHEETKVPPDAFDIRIINGILDRGDIFALLYLRNVLEQGRVIVDKRFDVRAVFLEHYGLKYRECEGLLQEVLR